jgi:hypothetical protein
MVDLSLKMFSRFKYAVKPISTLVRDLDSLTFQISSQAINVDHYFNSN